MAIPVPIAARIHFDDIQKEYRLVASREDPTHGGEFDVNEVIRIVQEFATLLEIVAFLVDFMSGIGPATGTAPANVNMGNYATFAAWAAVRSGGTFTPGA